MRKTHKNGYMSYVECRMLPINAMVLICISQLHFTQATHQSRLVCKQKYLISMILTHPSELLVHMSLICAWAILCKEYLEPNLSIFQEVQSPPVSWICAVTIELPLKMVANMNVSTMEGHLLKSCNLHKYTSLPHAN